MVGHTNTVRCVQMSHEKEIVISGSYDETIKIWCLKTGRCQETLRGHHGRVLCMYVPWESHPGLILSGIKVNFLNSQTTNFLLSYFFPTFQNLFQVLMTNALEYGQDKLVLKLYADMKEL